MDVLVLAVERWVHFLSGVTWIGLLYYFNFVQVPAIAAANADKDGPGPAAINKYVAPRALLWFRWGAVVTWLSGAHADSEFSAPESRGCVHAAKRSQPDYWRGARGSEPSCCSTSGSSSGRTRRRFSELFPHPTRKRTAPVGSRFWRREPTRCCQSRCCCSWERPLTGCPTEASAAGSRGTRPPGAGSPMWRKGVPGVGARVSRVRVNGLRSGRLHRSGGGTSPRRWLGYRSGSDRPRDPALASGTGSRIGARAGAESGSGDRARPGCIVTDPCHRTDDAARSAREVEDARSGIVRPDHRAPPGETVPGRTRRSRHMNEFPSAHEYSTISARTSP